MHYADPEHAPDEHVHQTSALSYVRFLAALALFSVHFKHLRLKVFMFWTRQYARFADSTLPAAERRNYKGVVDAFVRIVGEDGVGGLFRGAGPTIVRAMSLNMGMFASNEQVCPVFILFQSASPQLWVDLRSAQLPLSITLHVSRRGQLSRTCPFGTA